MASMAKRSKSFANFARGYRSEFLPCRSDKVHSTALNPKLTFWAGCVPLMCTQRSKISTFAFQRRVARLCLWGQQNAIFSNVLTKLWQNIFGNWPAMCALCLRYLVATKPREKGAVRFVRISDRPCFTTTRTVRKRSTCRVRRARVGTPKDPTKVTPQTESYQ